MKMMTNDNQKHKTVGRPFSTGDERINRSGRPKTFEELRRTADMIASELVPGPNGEMISRGELLLRSWIKSKNPILQRSFLEYWVGKPADRLELDALEPPKKIRLVLRYAHEDPDSPDYRPPGASAKDNWLKRHEEPATVVPSLPLPAQGDGDGGPPRLKGPTEAQHDGH